MPEHIWVVEHLIECDLCPFPLEHMLEVRAGDEVVAVVCEKHAELIVGLLKKAGVVVQEQH